MTEIKHGARRYVVFQTVMMGEDFDSYEHQTEEFKSRPKAFKRARERCREFPKGSSPTVDFQKWCDGKNSVSFPIPQWETWIQWKFNKNNPNMDPVRLEPW